MAHWIFSTDHLGDPNDSKSIGNQLLAYTQIISEINLPDRVQLVTKLEHLVGAFLKFSSKEISTNYQRGLCSNTFTLQRKCMHVSKMT